MHTHTCTHTFTHTRKHKHSCTHTRADTHTHTNGSEHEVLRIEPPTLWSVDDPLYFLTPWDTHASLNSSKHALFVCGGPTGTGVPLSEGGIMSAVRACGGSMPLQTFCWMRCIARANCSLVSLPICLVSAKALERRADRQQRHNYTEQTAHTTEQNRTDKNQKENKLLNKERIALSRDQDKNIHSVSYFTIYYLKRFFQFIR